MFCPQCGKDNQNGARFCAGCGATLPQAEQPKPAQSQPTRVHCPKCGAENPVGAQFCGGCGEKLSQMQQGAAPSNSKIDAKKLAPIVAAALVVVLVIFGITRCVGGGVHVSAESIASETGASIQRVFDDGFSSDALRAYGKDVVELMPAEAVDALIDEGSYDDREDLYDDMESLGGVIPSDAKEMFDSVDVELKVFEGDQLDDDDLDDINGQLQDDLGTNLEVTDAVSLGMDITVTAREDIGTLSAGESTSQTMDNSGLIAIEIDGKWYLWADSLSL